MSKPAFETRTYEALDAERRLLELGIPPALLVEVVEKGEYARAEATDHDPQTAAGSDAYRYRVRALRDGLVVPHGWKVAREQGLELTVSPCGKQAIITRAGDASVGLRFAFPRPLRNVGEVTRQAVDVNTALLFSPDYLNVVTTKKTSAGSALQTWMLLVHRSGDLVRAELSLPGGTTDEGDVLSWVERIILPEIDFAAPDRRSNNESTEPAVVDVPIARKR